MFKLALLLLPVASASPLRSLNDLETGFCVHDEASIVRRDNNHNFGSTFYDFHFLQDFPLNLRVEAYAFNHTLKVEDVPATFKLPIQLQIDDGPVQVADFQELHSVTVRTTPSCWTANYLCSWILFYLFRENYSVPLIHLKSLLLTFRLTMRSHSLSPVEST